MPYKNKEDWNRWNQERRRRNAEAMRRLMEQPCTDCGGSFPYYVMEWDHVPERGKKKFNIGNVMQHTHYDAPSIVEEIAKCDLVCANCHKGRTHRRRSG